MTAKNGQRQWQIAADDSRRTGSCKGEGNCNGNSNSNSNGNCKGNCKDRGPSLRSRMTAKNEKRKTSNGKGNGKDRDPSLRSRMTAKKGNGEDEGPMARATADPCGMAAP
jgi:hypothetical protein